MTPNSLNLNLNTPLSSLAGVSWRTQPKLERLGLLTVRDLLFHAPNRYDDFTKLTKIAAVQKDEVVTIQGAMRDLKIHPTRRPHLKIIEGVVEDESGALKVVWYNQPYLVETLQKNPWVALSGKVALRPGGLVLSSPSYELIKDQGPSKMIHTGRLESIYPETEGLSSRWLRVKIEQALPLAKQIQDPLPAWLLKNQGLPSLSQAIISLHAPETLAEAQLARRRLAFEELLLLQLKVRQARLRLAEEAASVIPFNEAAVKKFVASLPFKLTTSQRRAAWEIIQDLEKPRPMNRLLEGDVGTGKTAVAAIAIFEAALAGRLALVMAPTEILAKQHSATFQNFLNPAGFKVGLITSGDCLIDGQAVARLDFFKAIKQGALRVVIGTHSLLHAQKNLPPAALVIVDEQHRFGVRQRSQLLDLLPEKQAHLLSMTATPIPRTLALTIYGTLDISVLNEFPHGSRTILTKVVSPDQRPAAYQFIKGRLQKGEQAFIIYPLIDESEAIAARAAKKEYEILSLGEFQNFKMGLLHGQLKSVAKEKVMTDFSAGKVQALVATPVVEVGVDVPNATCMIIESAERFGLAQLHQLRGRIGRGGQAGYCFLFSETQGAAARLRAFSKTTDGFQLAEEDLRLRGPGDFTGLRQSGLADLAMQSLGDIKLVEAAQRAADELLAQDSTLATWPVLQDLINRKLKDIVLA